MLTLQAGVGLDVGPPAQAGVYGVASVSVSTNVLVEKQRTRRMANDKL